jgi:sugar phosphate isomerase/epimerase
MRHAHDFLFCLNTSTIAKQPLTPMQRFQLASKVGYDAIEPWVRELDEHVAAGGKLSDLRKAASDGGLKVAGLIGFFEWTVDDPARRAKGFEEAKRNMAQVGGTQLAAPPWGIHAEGPFDLRRVIERYRELCELGEQMGVTPICEFWGASKHLSTLAEAAAVVVGCGHPRACLLADVFHLYRGGSDEAGLGKLAGSSIGLFHVNDYPAEPARGVIRDSDRVWPGHGIAPMGEILRTLRRIGYRGALSVELFNESYYALPAEEAAHAGLVAIKAAVTQALA